MLRRALAISEVMALGNGPQFLANRRIREIVDRGIQATPLPGTFDVDAILRDGHLFNPLIRPGSAGPRWSCRVTRISRHTDVVNAPY